MLFEDNQKYTLTEHISGNAPQGPVVCFCCLLCNELPSLVFSKLLMLMFADDIKLYHTMHYPGDCLIMQRDINVLFEWSKYWPCH